MNLFARVYVPQTRHLGSAPQTAIGTGFADQRLFETSDPHTHASWRGLLFYVSFLLLRLHYLLPISRRGAGLSATSQAAPGMQATAPLTRVLDHCLVGVATQVPAKQQCPGQGLGS